MAGPTKPPRPTPEMLTAIATARIKARLEQEAARRPLLPGAIPAPPPSDPAPSPLLVPPPIKPKLRSKSAPKKSDEVDVAEIDPVVYRAVAKDLAMDGRTLNRLPRNKRRRHGMSLSCSAEEYEIIMAHCDGMGIPFSEWARKTLFRAIGREVPARPKRGRK